jgi:hypothetical protein
MTVVQLTTLSESRPAPTAGDRMSSDPYPGVSDKWDLAVAHALLAVHGVPAGVGGYDLTTLAAATYRFGLSYRIDRLAGGQGFSAEVQSQDSVLRHQAAGWEPEAALAFALSKALTARSQHRA